MGESLESTKNSVAMPYESAPPFIIIVGAFCAMAGLQYVGNNIIYGKPKVRTHFELPPREGGCALAALSRRSLRCRAPRVPTGWARRLTRLCERGKGIPR